MHAGMWVQHNGYISQTVTHHPTLPCLINGLYIVHRTYHSVLHTHTHYLPTQFNLLAAARPSRSLSPPHSFHSGTVPYLSLPSWWSSGDSHIQSRCMHALKSSCRVAGSAECNGESCLFFFFCPNPAFASQGLFVRPSVPPSF